MTDQSDKSDEQSESILDGEGTGEGIELTVGEPNSFEPEDDPEATDPDSDTGPRADPDPGTLI